MPLFPLMNLNRTRNCILLIALASVGAFGQSAPAQTAPRAGDPPASANVTLKQPDMRLRQIAVLLMPGQPGFDSAALGSGKLVISHPGAQTVDIFDPLKRRVVAHVEGIQDAHGIAANDNVKTVYIAQGAKKQIAVISTADWKTTRSIDLPFEPGDLIYVAKDNALFVSAQRGSQLAYVPLEAGQPTVIELPGVSGGLAYDPQANRLYASISNLGEVAVIDNAGAKSAVSARWKLNASQPTGLAVAPSEGLLLVAVRFAVIALDLQSGQENSRVPTAGGTDTLILDPPHRQAYAGSSDGTVTTIALANTGISKTDEIKTDVRGHSIAFDPTRRLIYLPGGREGRSKIAILKPFPTHPEAESDEDVPPTKQAAADKTAPRS
ncbi:MAG TPA: hypothetical protein VGC88_02790 [Terriglobales bacterium]